MRNPWRQRLVIGWGGMRGAISLAIALTLPLEAYGHQFTERPTLVFLAAVVVVVTLVGQGLTLGPLLGALGLAQGDEQRRREAVARQRVTEAGLARLDELAEAGEVDEDTANVYRQLFELRLERVRCRARRRRRRQRAAHQRPSATSWSARSAPSWMSCTETGRSATRSAAPSPSRSTCRTARAAASRTPDRRDRRGEGGGRPEVAGPASLVTECGRVNTEQFENRQDRSRLLRRTRPKWRQHAQGARRVRHRAGPVLL